MILDVGCGRIPIGDVNCDLMIQDSSREWDLDASNYKNFVKADVRALPFRSGVFDVVHCSHLIEHLEDPWEGINELRRVCSGRVAVIVPFSLFRILDPVIHNFDYSAWLRWEKVHHKHFFWRDPFHQGKGTWKFRWLWSKRVQLSSILERKNKFVLLASLIPIPFETLTVFEVDHQ